MVINNRSDISIKQYVNEGSDELIELWEASVKSTHHFLTNDDIAFFRPLIKDKYLPQLEVYIIKDEYEDIVAFMGLSEDMIEMLFVHPNSQGKGYGSMLVDFAIRQNICKVDVNEQNQVAYKFYMNKGFTVISRDELDSTGKPFPILHLMLAD